jgi:predicted NUDIX family phosphoesterase
MSSLPRHGSNQEVLVVPREIFRGHNQMLWRYGPSFFDRLLRSAAWLPRVVAETSDEWLQPIPCALVRGFGDRYLTLRRVRGGRDDLNARISLVVGGHIDAADQMSYVEGAGPELFIETLRRELIEELQLSAIETLDQVGIVIDISSIEASRHIAFVYEISSVHPVSTRALEEFSVRSKFTGQFFSPSALVPFRKSFDPWSRILFDYWIAPRNNIRISDQGQLPFRNVFGEER